ncbi:MAG: NfeD family protein [Paludibacteraceae bacterium]|nr:NfeD family protein [Paludibacteraceae bacterium]
MDILIVIALLLLAIIFLLIEFFLIPGVSVAGGAGIVLMVVSVWYAYSHLGAVAGNITLVGSIALTGFSVWAFLRSRALEKMSLKTNITGKVDKIDEEFIKVGDHGVTISRLAPMGKIRVNGLIMEAKTSDEFIDQNEQVVVLEVYNTNVLVEKAVASTQ